MSLVAGGRGTAVDGVLLPAISLVLAGALALLVRRGGRTEPVEIVLLALAAGSLVCKVGDILFLVHVLRRADDALYDAKTAGRHRVVVAEAPGAMGPGAGSTASTADTDEAPPSAA